MKNVNDILKNNIIRSLFLSLMVFICLFVAGIDVTAAAPSYTIKSSTQLQNGDTQVTLSDGKVITVPKDRYFNIFDRQQFIENSIHAKEMNAKIDVSKIDVNKIDIGIYKPDKAAEKIFDLMKNNASDEDIRKVINGTDTSDAKNGIQGAFNEFLAAKKAKGEITDGDVINYSMKFKLINGKLALDREDSIAATALYHDKDSYNVKKANEYIDEQKYLQSLYANKGDNKDCDISGMDKMYRSSCYSCIIVKNIIETFVNACATTFEVTKKAGVAVLFVGLLIWLPFWALRIVSSFANIEPADIFNDLIQMLFKVLVCYIVIKAGIEWIVEYTVNPIMNLGADYGLGILKSASQSFAFDPEGKDNVTGLSYAYEGKGIFSAAVVNKLLGLNQAIDHKVAVNLVVGHALTCHAFHAGMITIADMGGDWSGVKIPDIWIWICGAIIWFFGFMMVLAVSFYLLDISFKLGFAVIALPVVIGLWPFNMTKSKLKSCIAIIMRSSAMFAFLAITSSYALTLISEAMGGTKILLDKIDQGDADYVDKVFSITSTSFLILVFAFLYAIKLIGSTASGFADKFFKDGVFGNASPMHHKLTSAVDMSKKMAGQAVKYGAKAVTFGASALVDGVIGSGAGMVNDAMKGEDEETSSDKKDAKKQGGLGGSAGKGMQQTGKFTQQGGKAVEGAGKAVDASGKAMEAAGDVTDAAGKGAVAGGKGTLAAGKALSATGIGAVVGIPMMAAGATAVGVGYAAQGTGKVLKTVGKTVQQVGKGMQNMGKTMNKMGKGVEKVGKKVEDTSKKVGQWANKVKAKGNAWRGKSDSGGT